ncbi:MAG TPA: hypothetical protein VKV29_05250 [Chthonomonas sp.]|jgi:hypothetical protein|uniref:hypothetical protein n=1 Tax=Chthonomonas sp. TaxID=2282153 RepID=UPI002B4B3DDF|nr:hypothetical protein [Chthonomonas sp.]HLH79673.1 hypothetical protein [Chthonomonas sp.]
MARPKRCGPEQHWLQVKMLYLADPVLSFGIVVDAITETCYCISIIGFYDGGQMFQKNFCLRAP